MSLRVVSAIAALLVISACAGDEQAVEQATDAPAPATPDAKKDVQMPLPSTLRVVGDPVGGLPLLSSLSRDVISTSMSLTGVDSGIRRFCAGGADIVAVDRKITDAESAACKQAEVSWSAFSGTGDAPDIYVRREISNAFRAASSTYD